MAIQPGYKSVYSRLAIRPSVRAATFFCALFTVGLLFATSTRGMAGNSMGIGVDADSAGKAISLGLPVSYGSLWAGAWNQPEKYGWGGIKTQLQAARAAGVT